MVNSFQVLLKNTGSLYYQDIIPRLTNAIKKTPTHRQRAHHAQGFLEYATAYLLRKKKKRTSLKMNSGQLGVQTTPESLLLTALFRKGNGGFANEKTGTTAKPL